MLFMLLTSRFLRGKNYFYVTIVICMYFPRARNVPKSSSLVQSHLRFHMPRGISIKYTCDKRREFHHPVHFFNRPLILIIRFVRYLIAMHKQPLWNARKLPRQVTSLQKDDMGKYSNQTNKYHWLFLYVFFISTGYKIQLVSSHLHHKYLNFVS